MKLKGGPELKARLAAVIAAKPEITRAWAQEAARRIAADAPRRTGALASSIQPDQKDGKGVVKGNYYGTIIDRGTKAYSIQPKSVTGSGRGGAGKTSVLRFNYRGRTVFAKKSDRRRLRRRPFITRGAQAALHASAISAVIVKAYSRKRATGRFSAL